ncbi:unnamed protein product [Prunus brigantina]
MLQLSWFWTCCCCLSFQVYFRAHSSYSSSRHDCSPSVPWWRTTMGCDLGANTHITNDLSHLSLAREYHGSDNVGGVLGGTGLPITHIGHSRISHLNSSFSLNNILHCPDASLPLLSVHKFATDNNCFFTFFPDCFFIQDLATGKILFRGKSSNGLYPFSFYPNESFQILPDRVALIDLSSNRVFLSRHVLFDELSFPFHKASTTAAPDSSPSSPDMPLLLPGPTFTSRGSASSHLTPPMLQAQPSLSPPATAPTASPDPPSSDPAPLPAMSAPPPSSPSMLSHIPPGLPSPPSSPSPPVTRPAPPPSRFSQTYSRDPHRKIAFPSAVPVPSGTSPPSDTSLVSVSNTHFMATRAKAGVRKPNPKYAHHALVSTDDSFEPTSFSQANKLKEWRLAMADEFNALLRAGTWILVPRTPAMNVLPNKWIFRVKRNSDGTIQRYKARLVANGFHQQPGLDYGETFSPVVNHSTIRLILALSVQFTPRAWFHCFSSHLLRLGFIASQSDSSLFVYTQGSIHIYLLIYVDDILVTGSDPSRITTLISDLGRQFSMKDLGPANYFLGMELVRTPSGLSITQTKYVVDLLKRVNMHEAKPVCQFMHQPTTAHWLAVKHILRYLNGTLTHGLFYSPSTLFLSAFSDADYAGNPDDRRSTGGYCVYLGTNLISWSSKKQRGVSRSSTEAEYRQLAYTAATLSWFRALFQDLHLPAPCPKLWCDNISALSLASNPVFHSRTRHVEVDYHYVRERVVRNELLVAYCSTVDQIADIFTKGLSSARFSLLRSKLPVPHRPVSLRGCNGR